MPIGHQLYSFCNPVVPAASNNANGQIELGTLPLTNEETSNRMYVDPRNYSSLNQAFDETGVKEIPPKEIGSLEEIGVGKIRQLL